MITLLVMDIAKSDGSLTQLLRSLKADYLLVVIMKSAKTAIHSCHNMLIVRGTIAVGPTGAQSEARNSAGDVQIPSSRRQRKIASLQNHVERIRSSREKHQRQSKLRRR